MTIRNVELFYCRTHNATIFVMTSFWVIYSSKTNADVMQCQVRNMYRRANTLCARTTTRTRTSTPSFRHETLHGPACGARCAWVCVHLGPLRCPVPAGRAGRARPRPTRCRWHSKWKLPWGLRLRTNLTNHRRAGASYAEQDGSRVTNSTTLARSAARLRVRPVWAGMSSWFPLFHTTVILFNKMMVRAASAQC